MARIWVAQACGLRAIIPAAAFAAFAAGTAAPEFDVASVRLAAHDGMIENSTPSLNVEPGRNVNFANISLRDLIMLAYAVGPPQITGPDFITDRFDVIARVPSDAKKEQIPQMLQALLAERFKLAFHRDQKVMQIYALEVA